MYKNISQKNYIETNCVGTLNVMQAAQKNNNLHKPSYQIACRAARKRHVLRLKHENREEYSFMGDTGSCFNHIVSSIRFGFDKKSKIPARDILPNDFSCKMKPAWSSKPNKIPRIGFQLLTITIAFSYCVQLCYLFCSFEYHH